MIKNKVKNHRILLLIVTLISLILAYTTVLVVYELSYDRSNYKIIWSIPDNCCIKILRNPTTSELWRLSK